MQDASCRREDLIAAYHDLIERLDARRRQIWNAYLEATRSMHSSEYASSEAECWSVLRAGISGIDAEQRLVRREFEFRLGSLGGNSAVA